MRRARWISIAVLSLLFVVGPAGIAQAQSYEPEEQQFLELINQYRAENGLQPLALSAPLSVASERHSEDMGTYGFFSHTTQGSSYYPVGSEHPDRVAQEGYDYNTYTAENLAYGQTTAAEVFEAWRVSPGHNVNMLGDYSVIGIGLVWVDGTPYWTTDFGAYVDPSASGGGTPAANTPEAAPASADPAPEPASPVAPEAAPAATPAAAPAAVPETPAEPAADPTASSQKESAAADQYAEKQSARRKAERQPAEETAAAGQYAEAGNGTPAESDAREAADATGPVAVESAPAESGADEKQVAATETEPATTENAAVTQSGEAAAAAISTLPDTGGVPVPLAGGGLALLVAGSLAASLVARRALR